MAATGILFKADLAQPSDEAVGATTVWSGVYTVAQAGRGLQLFTANCLQCHGESFRGGPGVPSLVGPAFQANWGDKPLAELLEIMRTTMPPGQGGSLSEQAYVDILAELLQANEFPAGDGQELPSDPQALKKILITGKKP